MQGIQDTIRRLIETSLFDGVNCTHSSCVAALFYTFVLIISNNVYSTQCTVSKLQSDD